MFVLDKSNAKSSMGECNGITLCIIIYHSIQYMHIRGAEQYVSLYIMVSMVHTHIMELWVNVMGLP